MAARAFRFMRLSPAAIFVQKMLRNQWSGGTGRRLLGPKYNDPCLRGEEIYLSLDNLRSKADIRDDSQF